MIEAIDMTGSYFSYEYSYEYGYEMAACSRMTRSLLVLVTITSSRTQSGTTNLPNRNRVYTRYGPYLRYVPCSRFLLGTPST